MNELKELTPFQRGLIYRELQNYASSVCALKGLEPIIYHFLMTKTVWHHRVDEAITASYFYSGHESHCIRSFPRSQSSFYRARQKLERRNVITVTRTPNPNWIIVRLELPGLLGRILSMPAVKSENEKFRRELLLALDRLKKIWRAKGWPLKAVKLRPEIAKQLVDIFEEAPKEMVAARDELIKLGRSVKRICDEVKVTCSKNYLPSGQFEGVTLSGYRAFVADCRKKGLKPRDELVTIIKQWPSFYESRPKKEDGNPIFIQRSVRLQDLFINWRAAKWWMENRPAPLEVEIR
jgi:hypothetical protein